MKTMTHRAQLFATRDRLLATATTEKTAIQLTVAKVDEAVTDMIKRGVCPECESTDTVNDDSDHYIYCYGCACDEGGYFNFTCVEFLCEQLFTKQQLTECLDWSRSKLEQQL